MNHKWEFRNRFYRHAFGSRTPQTVKKIQLAVAEIKKIATKDPVFAADGAVLFFQKLSDALEHADVTAKPLVKAVDQAIVSLVQVIARAEPTKKERRWWLQRLLDAHRADSIPIIEPLAEHFGVMCASKSMAGEWADKLLSKTKRALNPERDADDVYHGTVACLSALCAAGRAKEIVNLVKDQDYWPYKVWAVRALAAKGKPTEAIKYAESCRNEWTDDADIDAAIRAVKAAKK